jgi:hypothetical protein
MMRGKMIEVATAARMIGVPRQTLERIPVLEPKSGVVN